MQLNENDKKTLNNKLELKKVSLEKLLKLEDIVKIAELALASTDGLSKDEFMRMVAKLKEAHKELKQVRERPMTVIDNERVKAEFQLDDAADKLSELQGIDTSHSQKPGDQVAIEKLSTMINTAMTDSKRSIGYDANKQQRKRQKYPSILARNRNFVPGLLPNWSLAQRS